jgi:hypothetical protein
LHSPGPNNTWQIPYTLADSRAELVRRLCRVVFDASGAWGNFQKGLTREWYACLLARRFCPSPSDAERTRELKAHARRANSESLKVWREMLEFASGEEIYDAAQVNARAGAWATRVNALG